MPSKFHRGKFRLKLLSWVTRRHRPDAIIEDPELVDIFTYLNPEAVPPSRRTLRRDIDLAFRMSREEVKKLLGSYPGRFNLILDCWSSGNGHEFMGLMVSFIHDGRLFVVCLDMIELTASHTGEYLATKVFESLKYYGIANRSFGHSGDNASNNDKMLDKLDELYRTLVQDDDYRDLPMSIAGRHTQIRCFGNILNLIYHVCIAIRSDSVYLTFCLLPFCRLSVPSSSLENLPRNPRKDRRMIQMMSGLLTLRMTFLTLRR